MSALKLNSKQPAFLNVVDIAGLVKGASEGQGLGNAFLAHIRACDGLFHLCSEYSFSCQKRYFSNQIMLRRWYHFPAASLDP